MLFAMARDNNLPAGDKLAAVDPKRGTPIVPAILVGVLGS
jgi:amino acid transporter